MVNLQKHPQTLLSTQQSPLSKKHTFVVGIQRPGSFLNEDYQSIRDELVTSSPLKPQTHITSMLVQTVAMLNEF